MTRCPHCFQSVLTSDAGICPACGSDTNDLTSVDPDIEPLEVSEDPRLPETCCGCGRWTKRRVKVAYVRNSHTGREETTISPTVIWLTNPLIGLLASLFSGSNNKESALEVTTRLPLCKECGRNSDLEPIRVDYDRCTMEFAVHREFAREYREINGSET